MATRSPLGKIRDALAVNLAKCTVANGYGWDVTLLTGAVTEDKLIERAPASALECGVSTQEFQPDKSARVTTPWTIYGTVRNTPNVDPESLGLDLIDDLATAMIKDFRQGQTATLTTAQTSVLGYIDEQRSIVAVMLEIETVHHIQYA